MGVKKDIVRAGEASIPDVDVVLRGQPPAELLRITCAKLSSVPLGHEVQSHSWFSKAQQMCSTIQGKQPQELSSMLHRSETIAESASGQLVRNTFQKLKKAGKRDDLSRFQSEPWYNIAHAMCAKLGSRTVGMKR